MSEQSRNQRHQTAMEKQKEKVDANIAAATKEQSVVVLLTGNGKGKTSSGFGMVMRALGYGQQVGVVQFIKGAQHSGEELLLRERFPEVPFYQMGTGFTWETQDREKDRQAAAATWQFAKRLLGDASIDLVLLDELTYMIAYDYLDETEVLNTISRRPASQSVIITGRGGGSGLQSLADTVAEVKDKKHAFRAGIKARQGVDY